MKEAQIEHITLWGIGGSWLIASILLLIFCIIRGRKEENRIKRSALYALGISNLLSPTLLGAYFVPVIIPATFGVIGFGLSMIFGDLWIFRESKAHLEIFVCLASWLIGYALVFSACVALTRKSEPVGSGQPM